MKFYSEKSAVNIDELGVGFKNIILCTSLLFNWCACIVFTPSRGICVNASCVLCGVFVRNYTQAERCTCSFIKFWIRLHRQMCTNKVVKCMSAENVSAQHLQLFNLKGCRQTNFLFISNQLSQFACCAGIPGPPLNGPPKYQMSRLSLQFVEAVRNLNLNLK